jgi:RNA polymerase sigma-70 factor (ECF subfamily)
MAVNTQNKGPNTSTATADASASVTEPRSQPARQLRNPDRTKELQRFEEVALPHLNSAYNLARWLTNEEGVAQDVVQVAYARAFRLFDSCRGCDRKSWLLAEVRRASVEWLSHAASATTGPLPPMLCATSIRTCIEALPLEFREVVVLREVEGLSYRQICDVTGEPIGEVTSRLAHARALLAKCTGAGQMGAAS